MLTYLLGLYLNIFYLNVSSCFALQHFGLKKVMWETFHCNFFCFLCSIKERKNTFNNENKVIIVSWFFSRIIAMKGNYEYISCIIKLMAIKIKWRLLPYSLP